MNLILLILCIFCGWLLWHSGEFQPCKNDGTQIICSVPNTKKDKL